MDDHRVPSLETVRGYSFSDEEREQINRMKEKMIIGDPEQVRKQVEDVRLAYDPEEMMVVTITHEDAAMFNSYRLLKKVLD